MRVIGTVGLPGSGKSEAAAVARTLDIPVVTMGDVIREVCRSRGYNPAEHHGTVAKSLREEEGPAAIAERSLPIIRTKLETNATVLVDGLRSDVELNCFRDAFDDDFVLISIEAPFESRAVRLGERGRDKTDLDKTAVQKRDERELGFGMGTAMERADIVIENTESLSEFHETVRDVLTHRIVDTPDHTDNSQRQHTQIE
jgi:Dephospho-CoA kinase